jgi:hypothetical protein
MSVHEKSTTIFINTREVAVLEKKITYDQAIGLAYPGDAVTPEMAFTVTYSRGADGHGSGSLTTGGEVAIKEGMVFDVYRTIRS